MVRGAESECFLLLHLRRRHEVMIPCEFGLAEENKTNDDNLLLNKTISDGGITVDFLFIKVHTSN